MLIDHQYHSSYIRNHEFVGIVEELLPAAKKQRP